MKNILFTIYIGFFCFSSCNKDECPSLFEIPIEISPKKLEYHVGDTITVTSKFYKMVYDRTTKKTYDMGEIKWYPIAKIERIDSILPLNFPSISANIEFIKNPKYSAFNVFTYSDGNNDLQGAYNYANDTFDLRYSLILKAVGTFIFKQESSNYVGAFGGQRIKKSCNGFDVFMNMNSGADNNAVLLKESPDRIYNDIIYNDLENRFYKRGRYCFKVLP